VTRQPAKLIASGGVLRKVQSDKKESSNTLSLRSGNVPPRTFSGVTCSTDTDASLLKLATGSFRWSSVTQHMRGPRSTTLTSTARRVTSPKLESTKYHPINSPIDHTVCRSWANAEPALDPSLRDINDIRSSTKKITIHRVIRSRHRETDSGDK